MSSSITQLAPLLPGDVNGQYDVIPIVSVGEIAPNGSMGVTHKITVENLAYVIGSNINPEIIMDTVAAHLVGGTGIAIVYDDLNDLLTISNTYTPPVGLLKVQNPLSTTLQVVQDGNNTNSQLYLATDKTQVQGTLRITTNNNPYIDAEDGAGNNRFTVGRDSASQQVNVDFASNPTGSTTTVGAIRTYQDGVNLSEVMSFREDGNVGIGTTTPTSKLHVVGSTYSSSGVVIPAGTRFSTGGSDYGWDSLSSVGGGAMSLKAYYYTIISRFNSGIAPQVLQVEGQTLIKGSGSTSATTSLLVQRSNGTELFYIRDDGAIGRDGLFLSGGNISTTTQGNYIDMANSDGSTKIINTYGVQLGGYYSPRFILKLYSYPYCNVLISPTGLATTDVADSSSALEIRSTISGFLPPRMTNAQRAAITSPATGLQVYNTEQGLQVYNGTSWVTVGNGGGLINTNTAVGTEAGLSNTTGSNNTALGYRSLRANTSGTQNVAVGVDALISNTTGAGNTATGYQALNTMTTGSYNVAYGLGALLSNTTASFNVAFGVEALKQNTTGTGNTALGYLALEQNTTSSNNTSIGYLALRNNTASNNTAVGYQAGYSNTSGTITALGYKAGFNNTTGTQNVFIGNSSGVNNTTGVKMVALGDNSANANQSESVAIGLNALQNCTGGYWNVAVGNNALTSSATSETIGIGYSVNSGTGLFNTIVGTQSSAINYNSCVVLGHSAAATGNNQFVVGSATKNAGTVTNEVNSSTKVWNVKINGVDYKILLA